MPDERQRGPQGRLPIKLIMPKQGTKRRVSGGGSPPKPFREVDAQYRKSLSNQVSAIREAIAPQLAVTRRHYFQKTHALSLALAGWASCSSRRRRTA